jgi:hypothetical protein
MPLRKTYIIFFITVLSSSVAIFSFFYVFKIIKNKNDHSSSILSSIQSIVDQKNNINTLQKTVMETKEKEAHLSSYLVHSSSLNDFIGFLEGEGVALSMPVEVVSVNASPDKANSINVEIKGTGSFEKVMRLLALIENAPYQIHIDHTYINKVSLLDQSANTNALGGGAVTRTTSSIFEINIGFSVVSKD